MSDVLDTICRLVAKVEQSEFVEEKRTSAFAAVNLMLQHGLSIAPKAAEPSAVARTLLRRAVVAELKIDELQGQLGELQMQLVRATADRDYWRKYAQSYEDTARKQRQGRAA
jgi:molecular chaperone GrpE (heat shock protein)